MFLCQSDEWRQLFVTGSVVMESAATKMGHVISVRPHKVLVFVSDSDCYGKC